MGCEGVFVDIKNRQTLSSFKKSCECPNKNKIWLIFTYITWFIMATVKEYAIGYTTT